MFPLQSPQLKPRGSIDISSSKGVDLIVIDDVAESSEPSTLTQQLECV
jgi:hypothetical protein